jgi:hypothetical protein
MKIELPIKVISEANQREHWRVKYSRKKAQQRDFSIFWKMCCAPDRFNFPVKVIFTRHASRLLDSDNLAGSFKHVRDALCKIIGIDDGASQISFEYQQEKLSNRDYRISVEVIEL